jgi:hypothetical protein
MIRLFAVAVFGLLACSGGNKPPTVHGEKIPPKRVIIGWGFQAEGQGDDTMTDVFLATTDETGKQVSHPVGRYKGKCDKFTPAKEMTAISGANCTTSGGGTELHAVIQGADIIVMQMGTQPGTPPDPMSRNEVKRVGFPLGAAVEAAP